MEGGLLLYRMEGGALQTLKDMAISVAVSVCAVSVAAVQPVGRSNGLGPDQSPGAKGSSGVQPSRPLVPTLPRNAGSVAWN